MRNTAIAPEVKADLHVVRELFEYAFLVPVLPPLILVAVEGHDAVAHLLWCLALINCVLQQARRRVRVGVRVGVRSGVRDRVNAGSIGGSQQGCMR